jgi:hypothetical protein
VVGIKEAIAIVELLYVSEWNHAALLKHGFQASSTMDLHR